MADSDAMIVLTNAELVINDKTFPIVPNSLKYTEGLGEQSVKAASVGGGKTMQVYSENLEGAFSKLMFDSFSTIECIEELRSVKTNRNQNTAEISGSTPDGKRLTRSFTQAALLSDYEVPLATEAVISIELNTNSAV